MIVLAACSGDDGGVTSTPTASSSTQAPTAPPGASGPGVTDNEIRLGMTNDVSGVGMTPYAAVSSAVQAYFTYVNAQEGGVCQRTLTLELRDDEYSTERALTLTQDLTTGERSVLAMIGGLNTQGHMPVAAYLNDPNGDGNFDDGIPDLFVSTGWSGWGDVEAYPWTTAFIPDYGSDARVLASYITDEIPEASVGLLYSDDSFGQDYRSGLSESFGEERMLAQPYPPEDEDISDEVGALLDFGAEVMVIAAPPEITAQVIDVASAAEGDPPVMLVSYVNQPSNLASDLGGGASAEQIIEGFREAEGVILTSYLRSAVADEAHDAVIEHVRIMETYDGPPPSNLSIYGQTLAETVVETLTRACPDLTRENVQAAAEGLQGFHPSLLLDGIDVDLSASDHLSIQAMQLWRIHEDGTLEPLGDPVNVGP